MTLPRRITFNPPAPRLTPTQLAQRRYKRSAKGRAAQARARARQRLKPDFRPKENARWLRWANANRVQLRVYNRTVRRRQRRERREVGKSGKD